MAWDSARAEARIRRHLTTAPEVAQGVALAKSFRLVELAASASEKFPRSRAILVEGVHLYGQLLDFETLVAENKRETEQSHTRVLRFLDVHYRVWDSILEEDDAIRVDYHGPRLHAVLTQPENDPAAQIMRAIALASRLDAAVKLVGNAYGFPSRVRFGIDHGSCLAMSTGRKHEKDILFLGRPANHAAKLAAEQDEAGTFLTDNARAQLSSVRPAVRGRQVLSETIQKASQQYRFDRVEAAASDVAKQSASPTGFVFHRATPPLSALNFDDLTPSNSLRMGMASLFADVDGYTNYVDNAIRKGEEAIRNAVSAIHVIREELNSVLKEDFEGKRVRFIGDCIQGLIAAGEQTDDAQEAVTEAALCASGMRSSFGIAKRVLGTINELDLAIGVEYGLVPLTRLGNRGSESVRCAAGLAVVRSEQLQQMIEGGGIRLGEVARGHANIEMREYFKASVPLMEYADAVDHFQHQHSPAVQIARHEPSARPHAVVPRRFRR